MKNGADLIAAAARTLERMRTYIKTAIPQKERASIFRELSSLPLEELAAMNPSQAEHAVESMVRTMHSLRSRSVLSAKHPGQLPGQAQGGSIPHHDDQDKVVVCASRASALAMTQTRAVAAKLARHGVASTILNVTTTGDRVQDRPLVAIGAESLFVKELELALRDGRAQYAVHSCKDLPSALADDMEIAAVSLREDPRDAFCSETYASFAELPPGARVGTSSLRRRAQLASLRSDLHYVDVRGNVDTRLRKLREGQYDAIVLACAGLHRLGVMATHTVPFETWQLVPAVGQGALAVETRKDSEQLKRQLRDAINDDQTERAVMCERAALRTLQGGCQAPIGIHAHSEGSELAIDAVIATLDGNTVLRDRLQSPAPSVERAEALGVEIGRRLLGAGAERILAASPRPPALPLAGRLVVVPRTQDRPSKVAAALRADGAEVVEMRTGEANPTALAERVPDLIVFSSSGAVGAAGAYLAQVHRRERRPSIAAMGPSSSAAAHAAGFTPDVVCPDAEVESLVGAVRAHLTAKEQRHS